MTTLASIAAGHMGAILERGLIGETFVFNDTNFSAILERPTVALELDGVGEGQRRGAKLMWLASSFTTQPVLGSRFTRASDSAVWEATTPPVVNYGWMECAVEQRQPRRMGGI